MSISHSGNLQQACSSPWLPIPETKFIITVEVVSRGAGRLRVPVAAQHFNLNIVIGRID